MTRQRSMTYTTAAVLLAIHQGHQFGFDIMDVTGLPDGTVYPALRRLESRGQLAAEWEEAEIAHNEGRPARRYYGLTKAGKEALREAVTRFPVLVRLFPGADEDLGVATA